MANPPVLGAPPWPPPPPAGSAGQLIVGSGDKRTDRTTAGARDKGYEELMARMFPPGDVAEEDEYWLKPRPPLCPGWGVEEWADEDDDKGCIPWTEDWEETLLGMDTPERGAELNNKGEEDGNDADEPGMDELLLAIWAQHAAATTKLKRPQDALKKTEEGLAQAQRQEEERKRREEMEEDFGEWLRRQVTEFLAAEVAGRPDGPRFPPRGSFAPYAVARDFRVPRC